MNNQIRINKQGIKIGDVLGEGSFGWVFFIFCDTGGLENWFLAVQKSLRRCLQSFTMCIKRSQDKEVFLQEISSVWDRQSERSETSSNSEVYQMVWDSRWMLLCAWVHERRFTSWLDKFEKRQLKLLQWKRAHETILWCRSGLESYSW